LEGKKFKIGELKTPILKRTLTSVEVENLKLLDSKKSPKKHRIFIRIPSLTRNEQ